MASFVTHQYSERWINQSPQPMKLFLSDILPDGAGELPPQGFELGVGQECTLSWSYALPVNGIGETEGYIHWWTRPSRTGLPGSGTTLGVKLQEQFNGSSNAQYVGSVRISTYNGSPTGNPMSFTDVTGGFGDASQYSFLVPGEDQGFKVTISRIPHEANTDYGRCIDVVIESA